MKTYGLTRATLLDLYSVQKLTQTEIAAKVGASQPKISKLLRHWGIPTLVKSDRLDLPEITSRQHDLLIGSLLGDGSMNVTGQTTARFYEGHCPEQDPYTRWKAGILEPFTAHMFKSTNVEGDYTGLSFYTHGCKALRSYYDLFYPEGKRVFPINLEDIITPFALAVWYMDDGSVNRGFYPRISFGLGEPSLSRAKRALHRLGLKPTVYGEGAGCSIEFRQKDKQNERFLEMVAPYVPDCMSYKIPDLSVQVKVPENDNAARLTPERAAELYRGNLPVQDIARLYGVGSTTVRRRLHEQGIKPGVRTSKGRLSHEAVSEMLKPYDPQTWQALDASSQASWVAEVLQLLRKLPFPSPRPRPPEDALKEFKQLCSTETFLDDTLAIRPQSHRGVVLCSEFFPNRYKASWRGRRTAFEAWHMDDDLRKAIRFQLDHGDPVLPHRVLRAVTMRCRTPTVFKPVVARHIYKTYCPKGGRVWDPCAGYGGRLMGALSVGASYTGTDVEPETVAGNLRLASYLGCEAVVQEHPAETFDPGPVDVVFTSPPYFDLERYGPSEGQSHKQHNTFDGWLEGFLRPVVRTSFRSLGPGQVLALNVADINLRDEVLPLVQRTVDVALDEGFHHETTLWMPISNLNRGKRRPGEPVLVFRKP